MNVLQKARNVQVGKLSKQIIQVSSCPQLKYSKEAPHTALQTEKPDIWRDKSSSAGTSLALSKENSSKLHQQDELKICKEADASSSKDDKKLPVLIHKFNTKHMLLYKNIEKYVFKKLKELYDQEYKYQPPKYHIPATKMSITVDHYLKRKGTLRLDHYVVPMEEQARITPKKKDSECICRRHQLLSIKLKELQTSNENKDKQTKSK